MIGAVVNAVLNGIVIPKYGIIGAACTTLFSQMFIAICAPLLFKETREFTKIFAGSFKKFPEAARFLKTTLKSKQD